MNLFEVIRWTSTEFAWFQTVMQKIDIIVRRAFPKDSDAYWRVYDQMKPWFVTGPQITLGQLLVRMTE